MKIFRFLTFAAGLLTLAGFAAAQQPTAQERAAELKVSIAKSQPLLRQYEWIEATTVSLKGDEKSRTLNRCYYGDDGKLQKLPVVAPPPEEKKRGLRGRVVEKKKEEMADYMHEAVALCKAYMPPDPARIGASRDAGKVSLQILEPGNRVRLTFDDYLKAGDKLMLDIDLDGNRLLQAKVASYLDSQKEPVTLLVNFETLPDTATYPASIVLDAPGKKLTVNVENSGYRKTATRP
jgi:hypothetical protein